MKNEKFQFEMFLRYKGIAHGISSKTFGSMKKDDGSLDCDHLEVFRKSLGIAQRAVCMKQIHGGNVSIIEDNKKLCIPETDALITNKKNVPLAIFTADCQPIFFYDPIKGVIGVAHAGYRGLLNHVIQNTIQHFASYFTSDPKDILVGIGPSIEVMCYEVGEELIEKFQKTYPEFQNIFIQKDATFSLDLRSIAQQSLLKEGILKEHIEISDICTKCDERFYSCRGGNDNKRFVSIISLV